MKMIKMGILGLGARGYSLMKDVVLPRENVQVVAVCDLYDDRVKRAADMIHEKKEQEVFGTTDPKEFWDCEMDAVLIASSWQDHVDSCIEGMRRGIYVACEVGGTYSIHDCWKLVDCYEETKTPVMMMENCCYGQRELMILNIVEQGVLGDIVHCEGGYLHDLRDEISEGRERRHYRLLNYLKRNCENYPTHEIGPIARILKINRGNRMVKLAAQASRAAGLKEYMKQKREADIDLLKENFAQGDIVTTTITCAGGETIVIQLNTTLPRYYSRKFTVLGTKGMYNEDNDSIFLDDEHATEHFKWNEHYGNAEKYRDEYEHPIWKKYIEEGVRGGHDGMDWLVFSAFFEAVEAGINTPIDVYDMASWMAISCLSEESISLGGQVVYIPDFTRGTWMSEERLGLEGHKKI